MAELTHWYVENNTVFTHTGSTTFTNVTGTTIAASNFSTTTKYLIIARAVVGGDNAGARFGCRVRVPHDTATTDKSQMTFEPQKTTIGEGMSYFFVHAWTSGATLTEDLLFQVAPLQNTGNEVWIDQMSILVIDLDAIGTEGTDYHEDIQAASGEELFSATYTPLARITDNVLGDTEEYLVLGCAKIGIGSTGRWFTVVLETAMDSDTAAIVAQHRAEGEDTAEERLVGFAARHQGAFGAGIGDVVIRGQEEANNGNMTDQGAYLIALPTSLFADFEYDYNSATIDTGSEVTVASVGPYTPSNTGGGNHLIMGWVRSTSPGTNSGAYQKLHVESGAVEIRTGDQAVGHSQIWDSGKDLESAVTMERYSIGQSAHTMNLRSQDGGGTSSEVRSRWLILVNLNEPATAAPDSPPPFPRRPTTLQGM